MCVCRKPYHTIISSDSKRDAVIIENKTTKKAFSYQIHGNNLISPVNYRFRRANQLYTIQFMEFFPTSVCKLNNSTATHTTKSIAILYQTINFFGFDTAYWYCCCPLVYNIQLMFGQRAKTKNMLPRIIIYSNIEK